MAGRNLGIALYEWTIFRNGIIEKIPDDMYQKYQSIMFLSIWNERRHICAVSDKLLIGDPRKFYFHHILEKRNYELYALCKWNIIVLTWEVHSAYENNPNTYPILSELRSDLLAKVEDDSYIFDNDIIWKNDNSSDHVFAAFGNSILITK